MLIHHGDIFHGQVGNTARYQMNYRVHLLWLKRTARMEVEQNGSAGLLLLTDEYRLFGNGQMDPCAAYSGQRLDGTRELAFQRTLKIDLFKELAGAEFLIFHQLETHQPALGQTLGGELEANVMHLVCGHENRAPP